MNVSFFLDTNILIYSFDSRHPDKQSRATDLIRDGLSTNRGVISYQVVQEFINVATRKFQTPLSVEDCQRYIDYVLIPLCKHFPSMQFYKQGLHTMQSWGYSWYDSLIISAAMESGCQTLYSEDLQHGQRIQELTVVNPFF